MQSEPRIHRWKRVANRSVRCVFCRDTIALNEYLKTQTPVCRLCRIEMTEFGWRTVYDREHGIGDIPANLRVAYKL